MGHLLVVMIYNVEGQILEVLWILNKQRVFQVEDVGDSKIPKGLPIEGVQMTATVKEFW